MRYFSLATLMSLIFVMCLDAAPPGQAVQGRRAYREGGKIKYGERSTSAPVYYRGNLIQEREGRAYRDRSGKIQHEREYEQYPYPFRRYDYVDEYDDRSGSYTEDRQRRN